MSRSRRKHGSAKAALPSAGHFVELATQKGDGCRHHPAGGVIEHQWASSPNRSLRGRRRTWIVVRVGPRMITTWISLDTASEDWRRPTRRSHLVATADFEARQQNPGGRRRDDLLQRGWAASHRNRKVKWGANRDCGLSGGVIALQDVAVRMIGEACARDRDDLLPNQTGGRGHIQYPVRTSGGDGEGRSNHGENRDSKHSPDVERRAPQVRSAGCHRVRPYRCGGGGRASRGLGRAWGLAGVSSTPKARALWTSPISLDLPPEPFVRQRISAGSQPCCSVPKTKF